VTKCFQVSFVPLHVESKSKLATVLSAVDKANGFVFDSGSRSQGALARTAAGGANFDYARTGDVKERYVDQNEEKLGNDLDEVGADKPGFQV